MKLSLIEKECIRDYLDCNDAFNTFGWVNVLKLIKFCNLDVKQTRAIKRFIRDEYADFMLQDITFNDEQPIHKKAS